MSDRQSRATRGAVAPVSRGRQDRALVDPDHFEGSELRQQRSISLEHASVAGSLPLHHRDPFDRMLIAQARLESLTIVTRHERFARYGVQLLAA